MLKLEEIEPKKIAYLIGFLSGDGIYHNGCGKRSDRMGVSSTDLEVVNWINDNIEEFDKSNPILNNNLSRKIIATLPAYNKTFAVKHSEFFNRYGILCKKEDRKIVNISNKNMRFFILGLFDADGCLTYSIRKDRDRISARVSFTHPSEGLLATLQQYLLNMMGIPSSIKPKKGERCFVLSFSKIEHVENFCEWLYSDKDSIVLYRKYKTWEELQKLLEDKRSDEESPCYPKEFMVTCEYTSLIGGLSKYMFIIDGKEYPSSLIASKSTGIDSKLIHSRCIQGNMGYSKRIKTEDEKKEYESYVKRQLKKAYNKWREEQ